MRAIFLTLLLTVIAAPAQADDIQEYLEKFGIDKNASFSGTSGRCQLTGCQVCPLNYKDPRSQVRCSRAWAIITTTTLDKKRAK